MRNLKRVLSMSLASIMLLGMMVIGSSAASSYTDVDYSEDNVEAIEVLQVINVMTGDLDNNGELAGTFRPGDEVSRAEMARIMAALMDLDYDYYLGANPFTDMVGHWAEGYAAACYANGIIAGRTNTTYDPSATVTAVEAAAMLMRALGYFQNPSADYPNGFEVSTISQAGKINLFNKVNVKTNEPMTRNDVAQLVLNTLQSGMVEPSTSLSVTTPDGFTVSTGATNYVYRVARTEEIGRAINETTATAGNSNSGLEGFILDLGEQLYQGKLKLNDDLDVFGRPARTWEYNGAKVGTYVKDEQFRTSFTTKVTGKDLYDALTASTIEKYTPVITIDGIRAIPANQTVLQAGDGSYFTAGNLVRSNTEAVGQSEKGVLTEVYVDTLNEVYYISIINTYLAIATQNYNTKDEDVDLRVYGVEAVPTGVTGVTAIVKNTDDTFTITFGEGDTATTKTVTVSGDWDKSNVVADTIADADDDN